MLQVNVGDLWMFTNSEGHWDRFTLLYILEVVKQGEKADEDRFKYLVLRNEHTEQPYVNEGHLTIRCKRFDYCWERWG